MSSRQSLSESILWILDWDGTLTKRDTLDALVNIAVQRKPNSRVDEAWRRVSQAYVADYEKTINLLAPDKELPSNILGEKTLLAKLEEVERRSIDRVSESGIFEGLTPSSLDDGAAEAIGSGAVSLREGCDNFLKLVESRLQNPNGEVDAVSIVSVNWSRRYILACLRVIDDGYATMFSTSVYANELDGIQEGTLATGRICAERDARIISSRDKLARFELLGEDTLRRVKPISTVYVGDSWTDLECLLAADLGICIRDDPMTKTQKKLAESLERIGVPCTRLQDTDGPAGVAWVQDFNEIIELMQQAR